MASEANLRPLHDGEAFRAEQECLGQVWTLLGCASDIPTKDEWFSATLGGRSVFIQRFEDGLRGFENRGTHSSYPLRTQPRGQGPIICGFHHWRYDKEGVAAGIPICREAYGVEPRALNKRLARLDIEHCGDLVFARFPGGKDRASLVEFLGPSVPSIALLCTDMRSAARASLPTAANWRLSQQISLDDYHPPAVHASNLGKFGHLAEDTLNYHRVGPHSAFFLGAGSGTMEAMAKALSESALEAPGYRILHLFPNAAIVFGTAFRLLGQPFRFVLVMRHIPLTFDRSETRLLIQRHSWASAEPTLRHNLMNQVESFVRPFIKRRTMRVLGEDRLICEGLQVGARQIRPGPAYRRQEARVAWFDEAYAAAMREQNRQ